jgi:hypothetical protein
LLVEKRKRGKREGKEKVLFLLKKLKKSLSFPYLLLVFSSSFPKINI